MSDLSEFADFRATGGPALRTKESVGTGATDLGKTEDSAHASGDVGIQMLAVRKDIIGALAANGDYIPLITDENGALYAAVTAVIPGTGNNALGKAEDAAHNDGDTGVMMLTVRKDTPAATAGTTNDYQPPITDANGALYATLATLLAGEDQANGVFAVAEKPTSTNTYAPDQDTSAAAEASSVTKASAGNLYGVIATNSSGSARYWQMFNSTTVPADTTVPAISIYVAAGGTITVNWLKPRPFTTGMAWAWSSTAATKTVGSTDGIADVYYK